MTDGEVHWRMCDFISNLSNAHFCVETNDGKVIDWMVSFFGKRDIKVDKKVWTKEEVAELGITYRYYDNEEWVFKKAEKLYGKTGDAERRHSGD